MEKQARNKPIFITLTGLSLACLISAFAYPLQKLEVWKQSEKLPFQVDYNRFFILTESDRDIPFGLDKNRARLVGRLYRDYKGEKLLALLTALATAGIALNMGKTIVINDEIDNEIGNLQSTGKKQIIIEGVKHRLAMASKSQRLLFLDEMKALMEEFGSIEGETLEADELNATDKFTSASYLLADGHSIDDIVLQIWGCQPGTSQHAEMKQKFLAWQGEDENLPAFTGSSEVDENDFRQVFPKSMDETCWKALCKGLEAGLSKAEVVKDVFGVGASQIRLGEVYFDWLKNRFERG